MPGVYFLYSVMAWAFIRGWHLVAESRLLLISTLQACAIHVSGILVMAETTTSMKEDSFVTSHHVYKTIWTPYLGVTLSLKMEESYLYHKYAVVVVRAGEIVGHVPRSMSKASFFLEK